MKVYTDNGVEVVLEEPAFKHGGEGSIYRMKGYKRVAKIYTADPESHRAKIEAMAAITKQIESDARLRHVAWPLGALYFDPRQRDFAGFGMRELPFFASFSEMEEYPAPKNVKTGLDEKVDLLVELAETMDALHSHGQVVGDANDDNIGVCADGHVGIVDADSFHATIAGTTYPCVACMPGYFAPEVTRAVQGTTFAAATGPTFSTHTDDYSLAVHVFKTLMNGVHPFQATADVAAHLSVPAPVAPDKRALAGESPFFKTMPGWTAPPFAPRLSELGKPMSTMFKRAFVDGWADPAKRPTAKEWAAALATYRADLKPCPKCKRHHYEKNQATCPYCAAEARAARRKAAQSQVPIPARLPKTNHPRKAFWWTRIQIPAGRYWAGSLALTTLAFAAIYIVMTGKPYTVERLVSNFSLASAAILAIMAGCVCAYNALSGAKTREVGNMLACPLIGLGGTFAVALALLIFEVFPMVLLVAAVVVGLYFVLTHLDAIFKIAGVGFAIAFIWYLFFG